MVIAVDIDGVLRDIITTIENMIFKKYGQPYSITRYDDKKITEALRSDMRKVFLKSPIYPGAKDFMDWLYNNFRVKIISYQPMVGGILFTNLWLKNHDIKYHDLVYVDKLQHKIKDDWDIIIEDNPSTVKEALDKGREACLIERKYNQGLEGIKSFKDYIEIKKYIHTLQNKNNFVL
jgi:uncharacterized HAD superfamily protein